MNEFESLLSQDLDFAKNKSNRIMICLCIDCSASMLRQGAMKKVNDGMAAFLEKTNSDTLSRDAADICIVSFGDTAQLVSDFGTAEEALRNLRAQPILPVGANTVLAAGVNMTLDHLAAHQAQLSAVNNNSYIPWLIIIIDGDSTERPADVNAAAERVRKLLRAHELKTMCLNIGSGSNSLPAFTLDGKVGRLDNLRVTDFFDMLSRNVSSASRAAVESGGPEFTRNWN
jgi:uncharacterized protein YegL